MLRINRFIIEILEQHATCLGKMRVDQQSGGMWDVWRGILSKIVENHVINNCEMPQAKIVGELGEAFKRDRPPSPRLTFVIRKI
jgi:hypothetical protein